MEVLNSQALGGRQESVVKYGSDELSQLLDEKNFSITPSTPEAYKTGDVARSRTWSLTTWILPNYCSHFMKWHHSLIAGVTAARSASEPAVKTLDNI